MILEFFLPYNNFIVIFSLIILNIVLILRRSYWQTFLIANILLLTFLVIIGFSPLDTFIDMLDIIAQYLKELTDKILDLILPWR